MGLIVLVIIGDICWKIFMFTTFMVPLIIFTTLKGHFQKYILHQVAKDSYTFIIYIYNKSLFK